MNTFAHRPADKLSWVWLAIGAVLLPLTAYENALPIAAWLAPVFLIRFTRTQRLRVGLPGVAFVSCGATAFGMHGLLPIPPLLLYTIAVSYGVVSAIGYVADRLMASRLNRLGRTLIFPLTVSTIDWMMATASPYGTWGSPAYSQFQNLPLAQVVSVTGLWGLTFLVSWFGPVVNEMWEGGINWPTVRTGVAPFAAVLLVTVAFGTTRLAAAAGQPSTVRVAALATSGSLLNALSIPSAARLARGDSGARQAARVQFEPILADLLARTQQQAQAGANIVAWSEGGALVLKEDESRVVERARSLARHEGIYLQIGLAVFLTTDTAPFRENRILLIDPNGNIAWDYAKSRPVPGSEASNIAAGGGVIPTESGQHGRLAGAICFDLDFPALIRQVGLLRADVLLAPADDWEAIKATHSRMHVFRAIENGVSVVRPTLEGISVAVDHHGRPLAAGDYFAHPDAHALVAEIPRRGVRTVYTVIGDSTAYLCAAGLLLLVGYGLFSQRSPGRSVVRSLTGSATDEVRERHRQSRGPEDIPVPDVRTTPAAEVNSAARSGVAPQSRTQLNRPVHTPDPPQTVHESHRGDQDGILYQEPNVRL